VAGAERDEEHSVQRRRFALLRREWQLSLYPQAAEAGGCLVTPGPREASGRDADPERSAAEAIRRARAKVRRYGVANRLNRHATLTYAGEGCYDPAQLPGTGLLPPPPRTVRAVLPHTAHRRPSPPAFGFSRQGLKALGETTVPLRVISPSRFVDR